MQGNWADTSSDEEEDYDYPAEQPEETNVAPEEPILEPQEEQPPVVDESPAGPAADAPPAAERKYDFPKDPPFTAFVGNLAYSIKDSAALLDAFKPLVHARFGDAVTVVGGQVGLDREGKHRGFGYVEVENIDQLKLLMELNGGEPTEIAGRPLQMDVAVLHNRRNNHGKNQHGRRNHYNKHHSNKDGEVDGSNFRGGRFQHNRRQKNEPTSERPLSERPVIKLAPRTKEERTPANDAPRSSIFGGAKPRDEQAWESKRKQSHNDKPSRGSHAGGNHPGGRGGGRGAGRGGRGEKRSSQTDQRRRSNQPAASAPIPVTPVETKEAPPAKKTETNKFALLMDDDSE